MTVTDAAISLGYAPVGLDPVAFNNGDGTFLIGLEAFCPGAAETGHCVALLLFVNDGYVGASDEARTINNVRTVPGSGIAADLPDYSDGAPMCCPSLWTTYVFSWDGAALVTAKGPSSPGAPTATPPVAETPAEDGIDAIYRESGLDGLLAYAGNQRGWAPGHLATYRPTAQKIEVTQIMRKAMAESSETIAHLILDELGTMLDTGQFTDPDPVLARFAGSSANAAYEAQWGIGVSLDILAILRYGRYSQSAMRVFYGDIARRELIADYYSCPDGSAAGETFMQYLIAEGR